MGSGQKYLADESELETIQARYNSFKKAHDTVKKAVIVERQYGFLAKCDQTIEASKEIIANVPLTEDQRHILKELVQQLSGLVGNKGYK
jgi:hypothetical protein